MPDSSVNPFEGVTDFFSEMARMRAVGTGRQEYESSAEDKQRTHATAWVPAADIFASGEDLVIRIDLAGMRPEDVGISFSNSTLSIYGERLTDEESGGPDSFYIRERFHGSFRRSITLPEGVTADQIDAEFLDGLVEITVRGGVHRGEPQRIQLKSSSTGPVHRGPATP